MLQKPAVDHGHKPLHGRIVTGLPPRHPQLDGLPMPLQRDKGQAGGMHVLPNPERENGNCLSALHGKDHILQGGILCDRRRGETQSPADLEELARLWKAAPVINTVGIRDAGGNWYGENEALPEELEAAVEDYRVLLYNHVFDKKNRVEGFFTLTE